MARHSIPSQQPTCHPHCGILPASCTDGRLPAGHIPCDHTASRLRGLLSDPAACGCAEQRNGKLWLFLDVRDDGIGSAAFLRPGNGLTTMHDRVLALGGRLHLQDLAPGLRLHALLRQPMPR